MGLFQMLFGITRPPKEIIKDYRESATGDRYRMKFTDCDGRFDVQALSFPPDPHGQTVAVNHKHEDGKLCVTIPLRTLSTAKAVAIHWMTGWSIYIRSADGKWPRNGKVRVNVPD